MSSNWPELHWRPSRLLVAALLAVGLLAACSVLLSGLPAWLAPAAAVPAWLAAWRLGRRRPRTLKFGADGSLWVVRVDGGELASQLVSLEARGPLVVLRLVAAGRPEALAFAPDTLERADRRRLRLWARDAAGHGRDAIALLGS